MLTTRRITCVLASLAVSVAVSVAVASAAWACKLGGEGCGPSTGDGGTVVVEVSGSLVDPGSGGSSGSGGSTTVTVQPPCGFYMDLSLTGKEFYEMVGEDGRLPWAFHEPRKAPKGWKAHKDQGVGTEKHPTGRWIPGTCYADGASMEYMEEWMWENWWVWVGPHEEPPTPPVPPELLLQAARDAMTLPTPTVDWNPSVVGSGATLVSLPTWFWLEQNSFTSGTIHAEAAGNSVTVHARLDHLEVSSAAAGSVTCPGPGTPWSPAADSACTLTFTHASGPPGTTVPVTATTSWSLDWTANGEPQGALDPQTMSHTTEIGVLQVQSIVTDVG